MLGKTLWPQRLSLVILLLIAGWLRWRYIQTISLYVDEFTTIWAATQVQVLGIPLMPSGVLYTRGLLASYVEAIFLTLFGYSYTIARLPSLIFGLATIGTIFAMGQQLWVTSPLERNQVFKKKLGFIGSPWFHVGWVSAVGLAFLPEAIIWSGRARFYAQLQWLVLLMMWAAFVHISEKSISEKSKNFLNTRFLDTPLWSFTLLFILALYSQEQTLLLYPSILLAILLWRGWRWLLQPRMIVAQAICLLALGTRYAIEILGQPGYFETIQNTRPYVGLALDIPGAWATYAPLFIAPARAPWTALAILAVMAALGALYQCGWQLKQLNRFHQATLFFALHFSWVLIVVLTVVGTTWRDIRYLFFVQTFWLLLGSAGAMWLVICITEKPSFFLKTRFLHTGTVRPLITAFITLLIIIGFWPSANQTLTQQVEGYDRALDFLQTARQPGDVVLSPQPPACALVLGSCDYYALQQGYEEYVIPVQDQLVDRWTGAALLNSHEQLAAVIQDAPRTWFITDSFRLATRYDGPFIRTVVEQFHVAFEERGVLVLQAESNRQTQPQMTASTSLTLPATLGPLALQGWSHSAIEQGQPLAVDLLWTGNDVVPGQFNTTLQLRAADGSQLGQDDGPPAQGMIPTTLFFDTPQLDQKTIALPAQMAAGHYRLEVGVYDVTTSALAAPLEPIIWFTTGPPPSPPDVQLALVWENQLALVGIDAPDQVIPGQPLNIRLVWTTAAKIPQDYTIFLHLVDEQEQLVAQQDRMPLAGFYPTSQWPIGASVEDHYQLMIPDSIDKTYRLLVGLYLPENGVRLPLSNGQDMAEIGKFDTNRK